MDPLSITGACVGLVGSITTISVKIHSFVREVRDARSDLEAVEVQLTSLKMVLGILEDESKAFTGEGMKKELVEQVCGIMANCESVLKDIETALAEFSRGRLRNGLKWSISGRGDMEKKRVNLESYKLMLNVTLELITLSMTRDIKNDTTAIREDLQTGNAAIKEDTVEILAEIARLHARLPQTNQAAGSSDIVLERYLDNLTSYAESMADPNKDIDSALGVDDPVNALDPGSWPSQFKPTSGRARPSDLLVQPMSDMSVIPQPSPPGNKERSLKHPLFKYKCTYQMPSNHDRYCSTPIFSPDGSKLAAVSRSAVRKWSIAIWDVTTKVLLRELRYPGQLGQYGINIDRLWSPIETYVLFSPNGNMIVWKMELCILVFNYITKSLLAKIDSGLHPIRMAFTPDGKYLATTALEGKEEQLNITFWDPINGRKRYQLDPSTCLPLGYTTRYNHRLAFSPDGKLLIMAASSTNSGGNIPKSRIIVWDLIRRQIQYVHNLPESGQIYSVVVAPPDNVMVVSSRSQNSKLSELMLIDVVTGQIRRRMNSDGTWIAHEATGRVRHSTSSLALLQATYSSVPWSDLHMFHFSPDGRFVIEDPHDSVVVIDTVTGTKCFSGIVYYPIFSPSSRMLAFANEAEQIEVWEVTE